MFQQLSSKGCKAVVSHRDNKNFSFLDNLGSPISADSHIHFSAIPLICQTPTETTGSPLLERPGCSTKNAIFPSGIHKMVGVLDA